MNRGIEIHQYNPDGWKKIEGHSPEIPEFTFLISQEPREQTLKFHTDFEEGVTVVFDTYAISFETKHGSYNKSETVVAGILNTGDVFYVAPAYIYDDKATQKYPAVFRVTQT